MEAGPNNDTEIQQNESSNSDGNEEDAESSGLRNVKDPEHVSEHHFSKIRQSHDKHMELIDPLILENCNENAEEIHRDLLSPHGEKNKNDQTIRDKEYASEIDDLKDENNLNDGSIYNIDEYSSPTDYFEISVPDYLVPKNFNVRANVENSTVTVDCTSIKNKQEHSDKSIEIIKQSESAHTTSGVKLNSKTSKLIPQYKSNTINSNNLEDLILIPKNTTEEKLKTYENGTQSTVNSLHSKVVQNRKTVQCENSDSSNIMKSRLGTHYLNETANSIAKSSNSNKDLERFSSNRHISNEGKIVNSPILRKSQENNKRSKKNIDVVLESYSDSNNEEYTSTKNHFINSKRMKGIATGTFKQKMKYKHRSGVRKNEYASSDSTSSTSRSISVLMSPRRRRKNHSKYKLKSNCYTSTKSKDVFFVIYGKKMYPIVKAGKKFKRYASVSPDDESDDDGLLWRYKYLEEKKKREKLMRLLNRKDNQVESNGISKEQQIPQVVVSPEEFSERTKDIQGKTDKSADHVPDDKTVKIKMIENNMEVQVEGHWSLHTVLAQLVQLLYKNTDASTKETRVSAESEISNLYSRSSLSNKDSAAVNKPEGELKISQGVLHDRSKTEDSNGSATPSTIRITPPTSTVKSCGKEAKISERNQEEPTFEKMKTRSSVCVGRITRRTSKILSEKGLTTVRPIQNTRAISNRRKSVFGNSINESGMRNRSTKAVTKKAISLNSYTPQSRKTTENQQLQESCVRKSEIHGNGESQNVMDCTFTSNTKDNINSRLENFTASNSEANNLKQDTTSVTATFQNSTLNTDIHKSESYQLLMSRIIDDSHLKKNQEDNIGYEFENFDQINVDKNADNDNLSNSTLPTSPVLSIVENISINQSLISSVDDYLMIDNMDITCEQMVNEINQIEIKNDLPISLMQQTSETIKMREDDKQYNLNTQPLTSDSLSLANKLCRVGIQNYTLSESINDKLHNMVLESNKKKSKNTQSSANHSENQMIETVPIKANGGKSRKRSSTPRKGQASKRKFISAGAAIEEEHMETCSIVRKSCPPAIETAIVARQTMNNDNPNMQNNKNKQNTRTRKKKDVIKIKIAPRKTKLQTAKNISSKSETNLPKNISNSESGVYLQESNDSIEGTHSAESIFPRGACGDSVEIINESKQSIISIESGFEHKEYDGENIKNFVSEKPTQKISNSDNAIDSIQSDIPSKIVSSSKWYLLTEDETSNTNFDTGNIRREKHFGADLYQIFPVTCAVPDLSTITEASKDADVSVVRKSGNVNVNSENHLKKN